MLQQLEVFTPRVITPALTFAEGGSTATDPIQILEIEGLGPVASSIASTQYGVLDGEVYNGAVVGKRNVVITFGLNPDWGELTYETLRAALYSFFMPKNLVTLRFHSTHMPTCEIDGYVESLEPNLFSKDPQIQVSVVCPYPYFTDIAETVLAGVAVGIGSAETTAINYVGTVPSGFRVEVLRDAADYTGALTIANAAPYLEEFSMTGAEITTTKKLTVSTVLGDKYIRKNTSGAIVNVLGQVEQSSEWPSLYPGLNDFAVMTSTPNQTWSLHYFNRYGGL